MLRLNSLLRVAVASLVCMAASHAVAQTSIDPPSPYNPTDERGVDLANGSISVSTTAIAIGDPSAGGLSYRASFSNTASGWRHSVWGGIQKRPTTGPQEPYATYTVTVLGKSNAFTLDSFGDFMLVDGEGTLEIDGSGYLYTAPDGSLARFGARSFGPILANEGVITSLVRPNGERLDFAYNDNGSVSTTQVRLQSVSTNLGYQLHFDYASNTPGGSGWGTFTKVTAFNLGVDYCASTAFTCSFTRAWPSLTFTQTSVERTVTDTLNRKLRLLFAGGGPPSGIARPSQTTGQSLSIQWANIAGVSRVQSVSDGVGQWTYAYSTPPPGQDFYSTTTTITDPLSHQTVYTFNWAKEYPGWTVNTVSLSAITNGVGQTTNVRQNGAGLIAATYPEGNGVSYPRNSNGNVTGALRSPKPGSGLAADGTTWTYGDCSTPVRCRRPTRMTDARGNVTDYTYDAVGNLLTETGPAPTPGAVRPQTRYGYQQLYAWYKSGPTTISQAPTPVWRRVSSSACATLSSCAGTADEVKTSTAYQTGSSSSPSNLRPIITHVGSGDGLLTATTTTTWDANGDLTYVDGPLPGTADTTRTIYDAMRQTVGVIGPDPDGGGARLYPATRTNYNADGQVTIEQRGTTTGQTDGAWSAFSVLQTSRTDYNPQGRKIMQAALLGSVNPQLTQFTYDAAGRLQCTALRMNLAAYDFPPSSACTQGTAGPFGPDRISYNTYDNANRLLSTQDGYGTALQRHVLTQAYTTNGKIDWVQDAAGNRSDYVYDGFDRVHQLQFPMQTTGAHAANPADYEQYGYDAADNPTSKRTRSGDVFTTTFDALNRVTFTDAPAGSNDVAFAYDNLSRRSSASHPGGQTLTLTWDALGRQKTETGPLGTLAYDYDLAGRRTYMGWPDGAYVTYDWDLDGSMTAIRFNGVSLLTSYSYDNLARRTAITRQNGVATTYVWDNASQLTSLTQDPAGTANDLTLGFTWNPAGQALTRTMSNNAYAFSPVTASAAYANNGLNQSTTVGGVSLGWDARGNLTNDGSRTFSYDTSNRLVGTSGSALTWDPLDRLYQKTGTDAGRFLYDGSQLAAVYDGSGALIERYVAGPNPDEWAVVFAGGATFPLQNQQQSVIALTDGSGAATSTLAYDDYGQPRAGNAGRMQYTGQMMLPDFGLQHYKARAYNAALGRFVQTDPAGYEQSLNLYAYSANDPITRRDPTGRTYWTESGFCETGCEGFLPQDPGGEGSGGTTGRGAAIGAAVGLTVGVAASAACDGATVGVCVAGNPAIISGATLAGAAAGHAVEQAGPAIKEVADATGDALGEIASRIEHGNSLRSQRPTWLYELRSNRNNDLLKYGITSAADPLARYRDWVYRVGGFYMRRIELYPNRQSARAAEVARCNAYAASNGSLPPLSVNC